MTKRGNLVSVGLKEAPDKEIINWMAKLNEISLTKAAQEFTYDTDGNITGFGFEKPIAQYTTPGHVKPWAEKRGFDAKWPSYACNGLTDLIAATLGPRVARKNAENQRIARNLPESSHGHWFNQGIYDHPRILTEKGRKAHIGFTTAPYIHMDAQDLFDLARYLRGMGLCVRMGRTADDWYGANSFPVMVWNPDRILFPETHLALNP